MSNPFMSALTGLARYVPAALRGAQNTVARQGGYGLARNFALPAIAGEAAGKGFSAFTGIPEDYVDMAMLATPVANVGKGVHAMSKPIALYKPTGKSVLKLASDRTADAALDNINTASGFTPQDAMQGFYNWLDRDRIAIQKDQMNYPGSTEWFYGSKTPVKNDLIDFRDFTNKYNTPLTPEEQIGYNAWLKTVHPNQRSTYDYDLQGYYKAARNGEDPEHFKIAVDPKGNLHFDDRFKKPNHKTFSKYSQYSGVDGYTGGEWVQLRNGRNWKFIADPSNMWDQQELQDYFRRKEPNNVLAFK